VAAWVSAAWGALLVLEGGLRGEVVYTALGAAGLALLIAVDRHPLAASRADAAPASAGPSPPRVDSSHGRVHIWPDEAS
jgi:hypothetical protein